MYTAEAPSRPGAVYLLPIARFAGIVWLIIAGALLPTTRSRASQ